MTQKLEKKKKVSPLVDGIHIIESNIIKEIKKNNVLRFEISKHNFMQN